MSDYSAVSNVSFIGTSASSTSVYGNGGGQPTLISTHTSSGQEQIIDEIKNRLFSKELIIGFTSVISIVYSVIFSLFYFNKSKYNCREYYYLINSIECITKCINARNFLYFSSKTKGDYNFISALFFYNELLLAKNYKN